MSCRVRLTAWLLLAGLSSGCGSGGARTLPDAGPPPPHQGELVRIPGGKQFVEVVQKKVSGSSPVSGEASFYFLGADGKTPISPAPTSGTLEVGRKTIALKPEGEALVTPSGPPLFARTGGVDGLLKVELDGKPVTIRLGVR
ncbi:MAG: hypothetical protein ACYC61_21535 [Isosphaeraceae bacterium]